MSQTLPRPAPGTQADAEVLARVCEGDLAAFELLMRRHNQRLFRVCRSVLKSDPEAEDAVQEAWLSAFTHARTFEGRASVATWLTKIALHGALARARKLGKQIVLEEDAMTDPNPTPETRAATAEIGVLLEDAIDALPDTLRVAFMLRDVEGLSTSETAETLGIAEDAVKTRLSRARHTLRRSLEEAIGGSVPRIFGFDGARCDRIVDSVLATVRAARG